MEMESELTLQAFDIVVVPFPFTDRNTTRRRPALVVSGGSFNQALWQPWIKKICAQPGKAY